MTRRKIPRRISSGIIGVLVIWVLVGLGVVGAVVSTPIVEEPLGENSAQTIAGDEVVGLRTETSKTYYLGNSTYRLISTGPLHYEDEQGDWQQIDNAIVGGQMLKDAYHLSIIQDDFDEGEVLEWSVDGEYVRFQPMALGWTNYYDMWDEISMPQAVTASVVNTPMPLVEEGDGYSQGKVVWDNAYGTGRNFQWTSTPHKLEKLLTLDTAPPAPPQYIIDGGNPVLRLSFIFDPSADLDIYIDGALWDKNTKVTTFNAIEFTKDGETLWVFNPVSCWDATGETQIGKTTLRRVGSDLWVDALVPYEWLQSAQYPISIDPTLTVQPSSKDNYICEYASTINYGTATTMYVGVYYTGGNYYAERSLVEFAIDWGTDIPNGADITSADMSLYKYGGGCVGRTYNCYRLAAGRLDWEEVQSTWYYYKVDPTPVNWSTAGASHNPNDYTPTDGAQQTVPANGNWMTWDITAQVVTAQTGDINVACRVSDNDEVETSERRSEFYTKEHATASLRPKLVIDYTVVPEAECQAASNIGATTARLNGIITDDKGNDCEARFRYGEYLQGDDFEWGIDGDDITDSGGDITWTKTVAGTSTAKISTDQKVSGTRSLELHRDGTNDVGVYFIHSPTDEAYQFNLRWVTGGRFIVRHGDGTYEIYFHVAADGGVEYYDGGWQDTGATLTTATFYKLEFSNVNWGAGTYDIYCDDELIQSSAAMLSSASTNGYVRFANVWAGTTDIYIDDVLVAEDWTVTEWQNSLNTDSTYYEDIASLDPETEYVFQTQAREIVGDTEGAWSASAYFETVAAGYSFGVVIG